MYGWVPSAPANALVCAASRSKNAVARERKVFATKVEAERWAVLINFIMILQGVFMRRMRCSGKDAIESDAIPIFTILRASVKPKSQSLLKMKIALQAGSDLRSSRDSLR